MALRPHHLELLALIPQLPDSAKVPLAVAAAHEGVSVKTIKRRYPLVKLADRIFGVSVAYLRRRPETGQAST
jgi:hypothetical protein